MPKKTTKTKPLGYLLYNLQPTQKEHLAVLCLDCGWMRISWNRHDYRTCPCPNGAMVDGGSDYLRCGAAKMDRIQILKVTPTENR